MAAPASLWAPLVLARVLAADAPTVSQLDNHRVRGVIAVDAPVEKVRAVLADPQLIARIDNSGTTVTLKGRDGLCLLTHSAVAHPIARIEYVTRVCPIPGGWRSTLFQSDDLLDFESVWTVAARSGGAEVHYEIRTIPDIPVPQFIVDRQTRASVRTLLVKLRTYLEETP